MPRLATSCGLRMERLSSFGLLACLAHVVCREERCRGLRDGVLKGGAEDAGAGWLHCGRERRRVQGPSKGSFRQNEGHVTGREVGA